MDRIILLIAVCLFAGCHARSAQVAENKAQRSPEAFSARIPKVDINLAAESELAALPSIGPGLAQKIVEYREKHGRFERIE
ncbi:MAG: helix-hairpin-helix domain-containing protein, partial [Acidobacteria bacterium]|nr:helix-hairpin-helix domain-containing protein [Acidobacteriota bacterium]